ncbi:MAG: hypothetical protein ACR2FF_03540 [Mycobacteriales bacterium]
MIEMWWKYIVAAAVVLFVIYAFVSLTGFEKRWLTRKTSRTAEDMYHDHADTSGTPSHRGRVGGALELNDSGA